MQNLTNEQLQFSENSSQIILKTKKSLEESDSLMNDQKEFFTTFEKQLQKAYEEITA